MDFNHYDQYFSLDDLLRDIQRLHVKNNSIVDQFKQYLNKPSDLFNFSINNGISDLATYLYIFHNISYDAISMQSNIGIIGEEKHHGCNDIERVSSGTGGFNGQMNVQFWSSLEKGKADIAKRFYQLRRYSKMENKGGKCMYIFDTKYTDNVFV